MSKSIKIVCPHCRDGGCPKWKWYADEAIWLACDICGLTGEPADSRKGAVDNWLKIKRKAPRPPSGNGGRA